jgi:hypothetical protein
MCPALRCDVMTAAQTVSASGPLNTFAASQGAGVLSGIFRSSDRPITHLLLYPFTLDGNRLRQQPAAAGRRRQPSSWPTRHGPFSRAPGPPAIRRAQAPSEGVSPPHDNLIHVLGLSSSVDRGSHIVKCSAFRSFINHL